MRCEEVSIQVPPGARQIIKQLEEAGYEAYVVGGCVRDSILGKLPQDWDITTSALPEDIKRIFRRTVDTGIKHGTVTVLMNGEAYEVTTYRIDGEYEDGRHPSSVTFTANLKEDLARRDFTINAMAYHESRGLVDIFGGLEDIDAGIIRCVGDPVERFGEDALRMLRAVRFAAVLGYSIEEKTLAAVRSGAENLRKTSAERIQVEFVKLISSPNPDYLKIAMECGLTAVFFPEFDRCFLTEQRTPYHKYNVGEHILHTLKYVPDDRILRLTMVFHDLGKPEALHVDETGRYHFPRHAIISADKSVEIMRRLKMDNDTIARVSKLVRFHDYRLPVTEKSVRRYISAMGRELTPLLFDVMYADAMAKSDYNRAETLERIQELRRLHDIVSERKDPVTVKELCINGQDLKRLGIRPGPDMGRILDDLLQDVLEDPEQNRRDILLQKVREWLDAN